MGLIGLILGIIAAIHAWNNLSTAVWVKILVILGILCTSFIGPIVYAIVYIFAIRPKEKKEGKNESSEEIGQSANQTNNVIGANQANDVATDAQEKITDNAVPAEQEYLDMPNEIVSLLSHKEILEAQQAYDKLMEEDGEGDLYKAYKLAVKSFILDKDGHVKGKAVGGLDEVEHAKRITKLDEALVLPKLGHTPKLYYSWWTIVYLNAIKRSFKSAYKKAPNMMRAIIKEVKDYDATLAELGLFSQISNGIEDNVKVYNEKNNNLIEVTHKVTNGREWYAINGAYDSFKSGISIDPLIRLAEIAISVPVMCSCDVKRIDCAKIQEHDMPSLPKIKKYYNEHSK